MILVQISDTHINDPGQLVYGHHDTAASLRQAIATINAMSPQPDLVLHTGDIASHGSPRRYAYFRELMADLQAPWRAIPGNHDDREALQAACADTDWMPQGGAFVHYVEDVFPVRLICCDSVIVGDVPGELCPERLAWLDARLAEAPERPTIVALHHPPFASAMTGASVQGLLRGGAELSAVLRRHPQVQRVIAGHIHRPITTAFGGTVAFAAPTTCYPFGLDMGPERLLRMTGEPPAIAVHVWVEDGGHEGPSLITHVVPIGEWGEPVTLLKAGERMIAAEH